MGRTPHNPGTRVEMLKARVTMTETGFPADFEDPDVREYLKGAHPAPEQGWFWIGATPASAADIRRRGSRAIGTLVTTYFPPQSAVVVDESVREEDIPVVGSQEHTDLMVAETRARAQEHETPTQRAARQQNDEAARGESFLDAAERRNR